ncbi:MAG: hypothetical protein GX442_22885 [Candidatus Riflebacteria bacterium]|nr:hypothetical protein [Candidatus Riflebacteria bacterium]
MIRKRPDTRRGVAIAMAIVFASILLVMALGLTSMTGQALPQNIIHDERASVELVGQGLIDLAALKFQLCPAQFYAAYEAKKNGYTVPMNTFLQDLTLVQEASSSHLTGKIYVRITNMSLHTATSSYWKNEVLSIDAVATYTSRHNQNAISRNINRILHTDRVVQTP